MQYSSIHALGLAALLGLAGLPAHAVLIGAGSGDLYDLDVDTNNATLIGNSGTMSDIALDPITDILYGIGAGGALVTIDQNDASVAVIGGSVPGNGLTFGSDGTLYASGLGLYTVDVVTGISSLLISSTFGSAGDIAFDDQGDIYMSASKDAVTNQLVKFDLDTMTSTAIGDIGFMNVFGLNYDDGTMYGFTAAGETISIDLGTGAGTLLANNGIQAFGADGVGAVQNVPGPLALVLVLIGTAAVVVRRGRG